MSAFALSLVLIGASVAKEKEGQKAVVKPLSVKKNVKNLPPLRLPDIEKLAKQTMRAERSVLRAQLHASTSAVRFWENRGSWLRAPRKDKCWEVPWQRSCTIARASYRLHMTLSVLAQRRLLYELPVTNDWLTAVQIAQRVFPRTDGWLTSCSRPEGGHGRWVLYQGKSYYPGAEYSKTFHGWMVGGPMQYMWPTFKGHYRHALDSLRARGYSIDLPPPDDVSAWRSMSAQALAAGWARWSGNDNTHWSASFGNGCS